MKPAHLSESQSSKTAFYMEVGLWVRFSDKRSKKNCKIRHAASEAKHVPGSLANHSPVLLMES